MDRCPFVDTYATWKDLRDEVAEHAATGARAWTAHPMQNTPSDPPLPEPFFHDASGAVRLWVRTQGGQDVGAILRKEVLHFRFRAAASGADALTVYLAHREEIDAAVLRRIDAGSIEPVLLREGDFNARPRGAAPSGG